MVSTEVQRTLVKSPPELWAELSDPQALARHLSELGEIRITQAQPEQYVEWEAETAKGKVDLQPSGWGTKVTLSVIRELPGVLDAEQEREPAPPATAEPAIAEAEQPKPAPPATAEAAAARPEQLAPAEPGAAEPEQLEAVRSGHPTAKLQQPLAAERGEADVLEPEEPAPRRGFFARLFQRRRRGAEAPAVEAPPAASKLATTAQSPDAVEPKHDAEPAACAGAEPGQPSDRCTPGRAPTAEQIDAPGPGRAPTAEQIDGPGPGRTPTAEQIDGPGPGRAPTAEQIDGPSPGWTPNEGAIDGPPGSGGAASDETIDDAAPERAASEETVDDPAPEHSASEETVAAQTAELLTTVLDSLGAAHHRPFSRA